MTAPSPRPSGSEPLESLEPDTDPARETAAAGPAPAGRHATGSSAPGPAAHAEEEEHESHGHSTAAWTAVGVILVGSLVMSLAVIIPSVLWFVIGAVIVILGAASGKVLAMAGYGAKASTHEAAHASGAAQADLPGRSQHDSGTQ